jgi:hypothetical protein
MGIGTNRQGQALIELIFYLILMISFITLAQNQTQKWKQDKKEYQWKKSTKS